jgi:peptidoglycan/LPS O-acetylase OafA/YrhL
LSGIRYRPEIDGLRAIAVAAVVAFHAKLGLTPGGFVGVDVFFVISGYLITSLIMADIDAGRFSILTFYERRIRRIFPALLAVIAACLVVGYWRMTPDDFVLLGRNAMAALGFHSNYWLAGRAGYFMPDAATLPLLHTWSLGVEEQFYVLAPLVLLLGAGRGRRTLGWVFWPLLAAGIAVSAAGVTRNPDTAFYLLQTRAFELMIGVALGLSLVPRIASRMAREALSAAGLLMIAAAMALYSFETAFPGFAALLPCVGAALLIHAAREGESLTIVGRMLATPPFVAIGLISYSLYLWHWPLFAFAEYEWPGQLNEGARLALCVAALLIAFASYRWIEQPARKSRLVLTRPHVFAAGISGAVVLAGISQAIVVSRGVPSRLSPDIAAFAQDIARARSGDNPCRSRGSAAREICTLGDSAATPSFLVWGDSHALTLTSEVHALATSEGVAGFLVARGGCPPLFDAGSTPALSKKKCQGNVAQVESAIESGSIRSAILFARWATYTEMTKAEGEEFSRLLFATVSKLVRNGANVTIIGPVPELPFNLPTAMIKGRMKGAPFTLEVDYAGFLVHQQHTLAMLEALSKLPKVDVVYPHQSLCSDQICMAIEDDFPLYNDDNHLNGRGTAKLAQLLRPLLNRPPEPAPSLERTRF